MQRQEPKAATSRRRSSPRMGRTKQTSPFVAIECPAAAVAFDCGRQDDAADEPAVRRIGAARDALCGRTSGAMQLGGLSAAQLEVLRKTIARELTPAEFDLFIEAATRSGLDPLRRQITPLVLQGHDPERRRMTPIATIDGLRAIAARSGAYRPMETAPKFTIRKRCADPDLNPLGIVRCEVVVWRRDQDTWRAVVGEAFWDEFAPLIPKPNPTSLQHLNSGEVTLRPRDRSQAAPPPMQVADTWRRMGRLMLAKCAEAQALRRGWPEDLGGLYSREEMARTFCDDRSASEAIAARVELIQSKELAGSRAIMVSLKEGQPLERVLLPDIAARLHDHLRELPTLSALDAFEARNRESLRRFWDLDPGSALQVKAFAEERRRELSDPGESADVQTAGPDIGGAS